MLWGTFGSGREGKVPETAFPLYADVRNVADTLYESIAKKSNGRFPLENGPFDFEELADIAESEYPDIAIPKGTDDHPGQKTFRLDGSKAVKELGIKYLTKKQLVTDTVDQFVKLGALKPESK